MNGGTGEPCDPVTTHPTPSIRSAAQLLALRDERGTGAEHLERGKVPRVLARRIVDAIVQR